MYHDTALPLTVLTDLTTELDTSICQPLLTEFSALSHSWNESEYSNGAGDSDFQFLAFLSCPDYSSGEADICNMTDATSIGHNLPHFTDLLGAMTTHTRNLDQQVLQERRLCGEQDNTPPEYEETEFSELKSSQVIRKENNRRGVKGSRTNHNVHLWEFVRDLLLSPQKNQNAVRWENRKEGTFRVVRSDMFAHLWGEQKKNKCMNYEKLSRALRHYYKSGILERVHGRLTYKFGKKAYGWREDVAT